VLPLTMATLLLSAFPCLPLQRVSASLRTSYCVQKRIGVSGSRSSKLSVRVQAQKQKDGGGRERREEVERDPVSDLENALGIENKTVRIVSADNNGPQRRLPRFLIPLSSFSLLRFLLISFRNVRSRVLRTLNVVGYVQKGPQRR